MIDNYTRLASKIITGSIKLRNGENIQMDLTNVPTDMMVALVEAVYNVGGNPIVNILNSEVSYSITKGSTDIHKEILLDNGMQNMQKMDAYLAIRGSGNSYTDCDIASELKNMKKALRPILNYRVKNTKWCILVWPTDGLAQAAKMSTKAFTKMYFDACCYDYRKMAENAKPLKDLMDRTDKVKIIGNGSLIEFSIKDIDSVICAGTYNLPDGEVFTAPVKDSVNGVIRYNCPTMYNGQTFEDIVLWVEAGKIVKATCSVGDNDTLNDIFDTDDGARYFGEFALGINPNIKRGMNNILFDEKIFGSFHLTAGACYDEASNGNTSGIHWDMVCIQTPEYGGGLIYFDDVLVRVDGQFVLDELKCLNK